MGSAIANKQEVEKLMIEKQGKQRKQDRTDSRNGEEKCPLYVELHNFLIQADLKRKGKYPECDNRDQHKFDLNNYCKTQTKWKQYKYRQHEECIDLYFSLNVPEQFCRKNKSHMFLKSGKNFSLNHNQSSTEGFHPTQKPHKCSECGKSFNNSSALAFHRRTHTDEKPYKCVKCNKTFHRNNILIYHAGEKPYQCLECGKPFIGNKDLVHHKRTHIGEKPYKCTECGKSFGTSSDLTIRKI
ncbi:zinc finger protein 329-like [Pantherophis guttatus]|uniref:Zinc finger protein 329-like n=1 Tax=Pantherophis guttatus TaxID=94885 RepID=A0A6P9CNU8_PANGU|nr:zinc finger protein 329-like [Pantherophis guttatus]XP_034280785.1 zinc finger protein 329-like [Pantherophis guttatus]XP_034280786.1 zinc finger protein 329-like [Pantherophis guttatus]XP_034280787.1 zinc finger protein 329-like [Pantherophis guttatus]XP_060549446.1 zinc finger protein 329-like [Pantherophis guttatus]